jgi:hypothetical protein
LNVIYNIGSGSANTISQLAAGVAPMAFADAMTGILYSDVGITAPGYVLWIRSDFLNAHKDIVAKFVTALLMGIRDTLINPNDAAVAYARHIAGVDLNIVKAAVNDYVNLLRMHS